MSLTDEERNILVNLEYEKGKSFLEQAEKIEELGYWDMVANRLYYAVFHAVTALLINDGHKVGTHKGVVLLFGQHYHLLQKTDEQLLYRNIYRLHFQE